MQLLHLTKTNVVVALLCLLFAHSAEMLNERNNPEGVDCDDNYKIEVTHRGNVVNSTVTAKGHHATITVTVSAFCNIFTIDLRLNSFLFSADYVEISFNENGAVYHDVNQTENNCFYLGEVRNEAFSSAAISTCKGIDGFFAVGNISYHIESQSDRFSGPHKVYKARSDAKTIYRCGHDQVSLRTLLNPLRHARRLKRSFIWPQDNKKNKIVELYVVADNSEFMKQGGTVSAVTKRISTIVNIANAGYQPIGIYLMLVGTEVWNGGDKITVDKNNKTATLAAFAAYRRQNINPITYNDDGVLITNEIFDQGTALGYAYLDRMCSNSYAAALVSDYHDMAAVAGAVMDHEIGHNFGLIHDDNFTSCSCSDPTEKCIMYSSPSSTAPATTWSQCSMEQFNEVFQHGADLCLYNVPNTAASNTVVCGNGIVESGEQCDCGNSTSQQCNRTCCDATTCRLIAPAACAFGGCCDISTCQILPSGTSCRKNPNNSCDLEDFCDGAEPLCTNDTYVPDGTSCTVIGKPAYCYKGLCRNRESQCELLWGNGAKVSEDRCYTDLNIRGLYYGNCGFSWFPNMTYFKCDPSDVKCGLLQCQDLSLPLHTYMNNITNGSFKFGRTGETCHSARFDFGMATRDPGLVPDGAACGDGQMCINQKCVNVSSVLTVRCLNCTPGQACNNLGLCQDITPTIATTTTTTSTSTAVPSSAVSASSETLLSVSSTTSTATSTASTATSTTSKTTRSSIFLTSPTLQSEEARIISLSLGIALGALGAGLATSLALCGCCFPGFFPFCCRACWPWTPATSTEEFPDEPLDDMPWPVGPVPMPSRMHWSPAANYFSAPPLREAPFENPSEFYYPQNSPDWGAMRRAMPFWRNENNYRYKLFPERMSYFSPEGV